MKAIDDLKFVRKRYMFNSEINQKIEKLYKLDNWHGLLAVLYDYLVIALAVSLALKFVWFYPVSIAVIASRQRALATLQHEAVHLVLAKNRTLNYVLGTVFSGCLVLQDFSKYKESHVKNHHAFLGDEVRDPDYKYHIDLGLYEKQGSHKSWLLKLVVVLGFMSSYPFYVFKNRAKGLNLHNPIIYTNLFILVCVAYFGLLLQYFLFWIIPLVFVFPVIGWFIELAEHFPLIHRSDIDLYMSRNRFTSCVEAFFLSIHNENYHLVHHLRPGIPFWNMKKAHLVFMDDAEYNKINHAMGGVFISKRKAPSVLSILFDNIG